MSRRGDMTQLSERPPGGRRSEPSQPRARGAPGAPGAPAPPKPAGGSPEAGAPPRGDVALGLRDSLASTDEGMRRFLEMLRQSGLAEAVHGYRAMQMVLVQQRLWAHAHQRSELLPLFQSLARTADELHRIFAGFAAVMLPLKELDNLTTAADLEQESPADTLAGAPCAETAQPDEAPGAQPAR